MNPTDDRQENKISGRAYSAYSWTIADENRIVKACDRTFFEYDGASIPKTIKWFFDIEELVYGEKRPVRIRFQDRDYTAVFSIEKTMGRAKLFWNRELGRALKEFAPLMPPPDVALEKTGPDAYLLEVLIGSDRERYLGTAEYDWALSTAEDSMLAPQLGDALLRRVALRKTSTAGRKRTVSYIQREKDPYIAEFVRRRAGRYCELCGKPAPFEDEHGRPYLECHHIHLLEEGGADSVENTVALCPNCHRRMHSLKSEADIRLLKKKAALNREEIR